MKWNDIIAMSIGNLWRRKTRTILTTLGVIIGSCAILLMISMGLGYEKSFDEQMEMFGNTRMIEVYKSYGYDMEGNPTMGEALKLNEATVTAISAIDNVKSVLAMFEMSGEISFGRYQSYSEIYGVDFAKLADFQFALDQGEFPKLGSNDVFIGSEVGYNFYDPRAMRSRRGRYKEPEKQELLDQTLKIYIDSRYDDEGNEKRPTRIRVTGLLAQSGEYDYSMFMDREALLTLKERDERKYGSGKRIRREDREYDGIKVLVDDIHNVETVQNQLREMGLNAMSPIEFINQQKKQIQMVQALLGGIGFVSLFVAAIGITNTMIMSIYERTREIGIIKVLGAAVRDILHMFLIEAATIGFMGGVLGVAISYGISSIINHLVASSGEMNEFVIGGSFSQSVIPLNFALLTIVFSTFIGLFAGLFPALRATRLSALEAIKNE